MPSATWGRCEARLQRCEPFRKAPWARSLSFARRRDRTWRCSCRRGIAKPTEGSSGWVSGEAWRPGQSHDEHQQDEETAAHQVHQVGRARRFLDTQGVARPGGRRPIGHLDDVAAPGKVLRRITAMLLYQKKRP